MASLGPSLDVQTAALRLVESVQIQQPDVALLAGYASAAAVIEPQLLRQLRTTFLPHVDAGCEADLWFSPFVESASARGMTLRLPVAEVLRSALAVKAEKAAARRLILHVHSTQSASLLLEESMIWESVSGRDPAPMLSGVHSALRGGTRDSLDILRWYRQATRRIPLQASNSPLGRELTDLASINLDCRVPASVLGARSLSRVGARVIFPNDMPKTAVNVSCSADHIILTTANVRSSSSIEVPKTIPPVVEIQWTASGTLVSRVIGLADDSTRIDVGGSGTVIITALDGHRYKIVLPAPRTQTRSPSLARRRLGAELRALREAAGMRLDEAAQSIQRSAPTLSRLESGKSAPRLIDITELLDNYGSKMAGSITSDAREELLRLVTESRSQQWFEPFRDVLSGSMGSDNLARFVEFESDASEIKSFEPDLIPGLLQTPGYAMAIQELFWPGSSQSELERLTEFRMARQRQAIRGRNSRGLHFIVAESATRRVVGNVEIMREQLTYLLQLLDGAVENVSLQVVGIETAIPAALGGSFAIMSFDSQGEDDIVYLESRSGANYLQNAGDVARFTALFESLDAAALPTATARTALMSMIRDL